MASDVPTPPRTPAPAAVTAAAPRWMRWLLVASLALNLLILGLVAGDAVRDGPRGRHLRPAEMALGPVASALDPEDRRAILRDLRGREDLRPFGPREREAAFGSLAAALRAEPFDPAAVGASLGEQSERLARAEAAVREALLARLGAMDADERAAFADRLVAEAARRGPGG